MIKYDYEVYKSEEKERRKTNENQFKIQEMTVSFVFSEDDTAQQPFFEIKTQYSNYNEAQPITDSLNPDSYKKIEDCTLDEIKDLTLKNSSEKIPTLKECLELVDGKVPLFRQRLL